MITMNIGNVVFVFSVSLQLAAALLLVNNVTTSRQGIIKAFCAQHTAIAFYSSDKSLADYGNLKAIVRSAWINKFAFLYLFFGYLGTIWSELPSSKCLTVLLILLLMSILIVIPHVVAKYKSNHFGTISIEDIPMSDGVSVFEI